MKRYLLLFVFSTLFIAKIYSQKTDFTIAFGSCNKQNVENKLWPEILKNNPDVWIWGGDNIYSDTDNMKRMKRDYNKVLENKNYQKLLRSSLILGTWDDHDYGLNDGGSEFKMKKEAQQLFLDFMGVPKESPRRTREGVYNSHIVKSRKGAVKIITLDTRYFRSSLKRSKTKNKRYEPDTDPKKTLLGEIQWKWLKEELNNSNEDFIIIVSSIQILSSEHGYEKWANLPRELEKIKTLIAKSKRKIILLSGDRHISEFSIEDDQRFSHPLVDFTSSGLTHSYKSFKGEPNALRHGKVVFKKSFGLLHFNFDEQKVIFEMRGVKNVLQQRYIQDYK